MAEGRTGGRADRRDAPVPTLSADVASLASRRSQACRRQVRLRPGGGPAETLLRDGGHKGKPSREVETKSKTFSPRPPREVPGREGDQDSKAGEGRPATSLWTCRGILCSLCGPKKVKLTPRWSLGAEVSVARRLAEIPADLL